MERTTGRGTKLGADRGAAARSLNLVMGIWLFATAFLWQHTDASRLNTWLVGVLVGACAFVAAWVPMARWGNTALSIWLFFSSLSLYHLSGATLWNNVIVAIIVFLASLVPGSATGREGRPPRYVTP